MQDKRNSFFVGRVRPGDSSDGLFGTDLVVSLIPVGKMEASQAYQVAGLFKSEVLDYLTPVQILWLFRQTKITTCLSKKKRPADNELKALISALIMGRCPVQQEQADDTAISLVSILNIMSLADVMALVGRFRSYEELSGPRTLDDIGIMHVRRIERKDDFTEFVV